MAAGAAACLVCVLLGGDEGFRIRLENSAPVAALAGEPPVGQWARQLVYPISLLPLVTTNAPQGPHIFTRYVLPTGAPEGVGTVRASWT